MMTEDKLCQTFIPHESQGNSCNLSLISRPKCFLINTQNFKLMPTFNPPMKINQNVQYIGLKKPLPTLGVESMRGGVDPLKSKLKPRV